MSVDRWWNPLTRWLRADAPAAASPAAQRPTPAVVPAAAAAQSPVAPATTPAPAPVEVTRDAPQAPAAVEEAPASRNLRFFCWMVGVAFDPRVAARPAPGALMGEMLGRVDEIIASESLRAGLLPRAPHVVPQLMKTLRDESYSSADVADRISRAAVLTAEVVRSATSILQRDDDGEEIDLRARSP
jgi:hypothetical protein